MVQGKGLSIKESGIRQDEKSEHRDSVCVCQNRRRSGAGYGLDYEKCRRLEPMNIKKAHPSVRKEITLDRLANHWNDQGLLHKVVGFHHLHNLYFLQIWRS